MSKINITYKLMILPIVIIISMVVLSFLFSQKIQILKKEVDLIYFGNFVPVDKLHNIKEKYIHIINTKKVTSSTKKYIFKEWDYYYKGYKTDEEKKLIKEINNQLHHAFKTKKTIDFKRSLQHIKALIKHEVNSAYIQRKSFLEEYTKMENYLLYAQIAIIVLVLILSAYIIIQAIIQNKKLSYLNEKYKIEANTDGLTGLYNRKYFDSVIEDLAPITKHNGWTSVFVMIDIDYFKQFNDTYGHDAGDIALQKVASVLDELLDKDYEYAFRLGGEEFGIIIFNTNAKYVVYTLNNLQHKIKELQIPHSASATKQLTLSMGVSIIDKNLYDISVKDLYNLADSRLYKSKENGRNQYTFH